ncbi:hypothetical protein WJX77_000824 [Trebouxia sp. C0004]
MLTNNIRELGGTNRSHGMQNVSPQCKLAALHSRLTHVSRCTAGRRTCICFRVSAIAQATRQGAWILN